MPRIFLIAILIVLLCPHSANAQAPHYNFRHLGAAQGLSDGVVRAIGQDRYGYIWIGTLSGLNRYDGYSVTAFYNRPGDSTSLPPSTVRAILGDRSGNLWIGCENGLFAFDFTRQQFRPVAALQQLSVWKMQETKGGMLVVETSKGMYTFHPANGKVRYLKGLNDINDFHTSGGNLYLATKSGVVVMNINSLQGRLYRLPTGLGSNVSQVCTDGRGNIWCNITEQNATLVKADAAWKNFRTYDVFRHSATGFTDGAVNRMMVDQRGGLWCGTNLNGIAQYDYEHDRFNFHRHDPTRPSSLAANLTGSLFQGSKGFIWIGTEGNGVDYFHPEQNLFQTLLPPDPVIRDMQGLWTRSLATDGAGRYWMGTGYGLLERYDTTQEYRLLGNKRNRPPQLHSNSIRPLLYDRNGVLWIGTNKGVNAYTPTTGNMRFFTEKDSLPQTFYWSLLQDSAGTIWFGARNNLYYLPAGEKSIRSVAQHAQLRVLHQRGIRCMYEDPQHRLWFGTNGSGLVCFDPVNGKVQQWQRSETDDATLINNSIIAIIADKKGIIWISSFTGLTSYDPARGKFRRYDAASGMPSIKTSALAVDKQNRLWIGSTRGLLLLDSTRSRFKSFDMADGLPTMEFSDMTGTELPDGRFAFPTLKGYLVFDPNAYHEEGRHLSVYLSNVALNSQRTRILNPEELTELRLRHDENFFSFSLTALNYNNPEQTWYAYKLEGFDKDWIYTKEHTLNYTNVPGGRYTFRFKATADPNIWPDAERVLQVRVGTVFYQTTWFIAGLLLVAAVLLYGLYRYRMQQQRQIFQLQTKAQALEKEKALVMYESLKQQLNPHFLFNSLTSLGSLIKTDQRLAGSFLNGLSKIYRYILSNRDVELITLKDEIAFVQHYIQLQKARFEAGLDIQIEVPEWHHTRKIAPVTLQNLVENAIKHNIIDDDTPLVIRMYTEGEYLIVANNLQRKRFVETSNKKGLEHLQSLYAYLANEPLYIIETENQFIIKIPLL